MQHQHCSQGCLSYNAWSAPKADRQHHGCHDGRNLAFLFWGYRGAFHPPSSDQRPKQTWYEPAQRPASTGTALSTSMIEVHLVCVAPSAGKKMGRQTKKVPGELMPDRPAEGLTVTNIIQLLDRISCAVLCCQQAQTLAQIPIECHQCQMPCVHLTE